MKDTNVVQRLIAFFMTIVATFTSVFDGNLKGGIRMNTKNATRKMRSLTALAMALAMVLSLLGGIPFAPMTVQATTPTTQYRVIGNAMDIPGSLPSDFKEVTLEEATAYGQSFTGTVGWLIIYAKDGNNYKFVKYSPEITLRNGTQTWDNIVYGESGIYSDPTQVSIIVPYFSTYTVTLNTNGGTINSGNITSYTEGTGATLPTDVTKDGYTFEGWFANEGLTGDKVESIGTSETGNKEFWAKWTEDAPANTPTYTVTIPATLEVANKGWNELTGGITAKGSDFADNQKLSVTAKSANNEASKGWVLASTDTSNDATIGYNLVTTGDSDSTYSSSATPASWEFSKTELTANEGAGTTKTAGIVVEDFSSKPAGSYEDTVTFTASVETESVQNITFTVKRVATEGGNYNYTDGTYTVESGTTWQQFINSGNAPACLSIGTSGIYSGKVCHDMDNGLFDCGGTLIANVADKKRAKSSDAIIDGATYGCSDYLQYQDHD